MTDALLLRYSRYIGDTRSAFNAKMGFHPNGKWHSYDFIPYHYLLTMYCVVEQVTMRNYFAHLHFALLHFIHYILGANKYVEHGWSSLY